MTPFDILQFADWGILLSLAIALGGSLYLGIFALSLFPLIPGMPATFGPLWLLATPPVTIFAGFLYLLVWAVRRHPSAEFIWEFTNLGIRPVAVSLLSAVVLGQVSTSASAAAMLGAGAIAGFIQLLRIGWMLLDHHSDWVPARRWIQKLGGDTAAVGLLWLTLLYPLIGPIVGGVGLIGVIAMSRSAFRSGRFSLRLAGGMFRAATGRGGWRGDSQVPRWVRKALTSEGTTGLQIHATPVALVWTHRASTFRDGWLVLAAAGPVLFFRSFTRVWEVPLHGMATGKVSEHPHLSAIATMDAEGDLVLLLPRGGPGTNELAGAIAERSRRKPLTP